MWKKILLWILGILGVSVILIALAFGPMVRDYITIETIDGGNGIYYLTDYGGNSGLILGDSVAVLIDTKMAKGAEKLKAFVDEKIGQRELVIINTHFHGDHVMGNSAFPGVKIYAGNYGREMWLTENKEATLPTEWVKGNMSIPIGNGEKVEIIDVGQNHTLKDLFVYSPQHKVLFSGDIYCHESHPVMKEGSSPNLVKWEETLRQYAANDLEIDLVVPGHGDMAEKEDLLLMADYFMDIKTMPKKAVKKKYKKWLSLPFLAGMKKSLNYMESNPSP